MSNSKTTFEKDGISAKIKFCSSGKNKTRFELKVVIDDIPYSQSGTYDHKKERFLFDVSATEKATRVQDFIIQNGTELLRMCKAIKDGNE